jgi:hypothetical protein
MAARETGPPRARHSSDTVERSSGTVALSAAEPRDRSAGLCGCFFDEW